MVISISYRRTHAHPGAGLYIVLFFFSSFFTHNVTVTGYSLSNFDVGTLYISHRRERRWPVTSDARAAAGIPRAIPPPRRKTCYRAQPSSRSKHTHTHTHTQTHVSLSEFIWYTSRAMIRNTTISCRPPAQPIVSVLDRFNGDRQIRTRDENMHQQGGVQLKI